MQTKAWRNFFLTSLPGDLHVSLDIIMKHDMYNPNTRKKNEVALIILD